MKRKLCRAAACPRHVEDQQLFCQVHFRQLTPSLAAPIIDNREAPRGASPGAFRRIRTGTTQAVAFFAKKEGRATDLAVAVRTQSYATGQGGTGNVSSSADASTSSGSDIFSETDRYDLR